ncbi:hypothetical protein CFBP6625_08095 [Agrobacterium tumefaciens]|nr:hypothetical protein CFBP6625_08095 [Agrobacterium tumefaciens]
MGKFKKGDEVRLINSGDYNGHGRYGKTGELGTVIQYDAVDHTYYVDFSESGRWWAKASNLEPSAATIKIEAGKFYRTRDGRKVGPMERREGYLFHEGWHYNASGECCYRGRSGDCVQKDREIIAEWIDEPVAKPSNDNVQPKFKVGDIVTPSHGWSKDCATVTQIKDGRVSVRWNNGAFGSEHGWREDELSPVLLRPTTTIVALIENGQPKPSSTPHVHASTGAAEKEAKRLAAKYKGKQFGVFTLTTTHEEAAPVYDHKWQNMAALGLKIDAIKELRAVAGLDLLSAKRAVEAFEQAA